MAIDEQMDWASTAAGQKALVELHAARMAARKAKLQERKRITDEFVKARPGLEAGLNDALAEHTAWEKQGEVVKAQVRSQRYALWSAHNAYSYATERIDEELRRGLPATSFAMIEDFRRLFDDEFQRLRRSSIQSEERSTGFWSKVSRRELTEVWSTKPAVERRLQAIREAQRIACDILPLEADVSPSAIAKRLEQLRSELPEVVMERVAPASEAAASA